MPFSIPFVDGFDWKLFPISKGEEFEALFTLEEIRRIVFNFDMNKFLGLS